MGRNRQSKSDKAMFANLNLKKGREVRIKSGDEQGNFGVIERITEDAGKQFLRIKLDRLNKHVEKTPDEITPIPEISLVEEFSKLEDFEGKEEWALSTGDDAEATKDFIADPRKDDFDSFMILIDEGAIEQAYGFNGTMDHTDVTRLETVEEHLKRVIV